MKFSLTILLSVFAISGIYAQKSDEELDAMANLLAIQKKEAVALLVPTKGKDSVAFWKVYNEYNEKNKVTIKARIALYEKTVQAYTNMTPAIADSLAMQYFSNRIDQEKSLELYYKKMKAATNAIIAFEFYQAEAYMLTQIRATIMEQIPTYGEIESTFMRKR